MRRKVVVTNTVLPIQPRSDRARGELPVLNVAPLLGEAIGRMWTGGSLVELPADDHSITAGADERPLVRGVDDTELPVALESRAWSA